MGLFTAGQPISRARRNAKAVNKDRDGYERKLEEYKQVLDAYKENLSSYEMKLKSYQATEEDQMAAVQVALDLTYLKEELDNMKFNQEEAVKKRDELLQKVTRLDNVIIEPIKRNSFENKNEIVTKLDNVIQTIEQKHKGLKIALGFSLFFNLVSLIGLVIVILYMLDIIWL